MCYCYHWSCHIAMQAIQKNSYNRAKKSQSQCVKWSMGHNGHNVYLSNIKCAQKIIYSILFCVHCIILKCFCVVFKRTTSKQTIKCGTTTLFFRVHDSITQLHNKTTQKKSKTWSNTKQIARHNAMACFKPK